MVSQFSYQLIYFYMNRKKPKKTLGLHSHRRVRIRFHRNKSDKCRELALFFPRVISVRDHFNINEKPDRESVEASKVHTPQTRPEQNKSRKPTRPRAPVHRLYIYECIKYTTFSGVPYRKRWSFFLLVGRRFSFYELF